MRQRRARGADDYDHDAPDDRAAADDCDANDDYALLIERFPRRERARALRALFLYDFFFFGGGGGAGGSADSSALCASSSAA